MCLLLFLVFVTCNNCHRLARQIPILINQMEAKIPLPQTSFTPLSPPPSLLPLPSKCHSSIFEGQVSYSHAHQKLSGGQKLFGEFCFVVFVLRDYDTQFYKNFKIYLLRSTFPYSNIYLFVEAARPNVLRFTFCKKNY